MKRLQSLFLLLTVSASLFSQVFNPSQMKEILYGVAYYHENMPYNRLDLDIQLMKECGINVVRIAESSWGKMEPQDGKFEFAWLDQIINAMGKANIKIIVGTPTYSIPTWLAKKHPEIMLGGENSYGMRQNMDITNSTFRFYADRIIRQLISHVKDFPQVIGYQIDNETKHYETSGKEVQYDFVKYLKNKYVSIDTINKIWGLNYWGQLIPDWEDFPSPVTATNPSIKLEWDRYQRQLVTDYLAWQASIVRENKRNDQFITHNSDFETRSGIAGPNTKNNHFDIAKNLDIAGIDIYYGVQDGFDGLIISLEGDWTRSVKQTNYLVLETDIQTQSWDSQWQFPPYDGQVRLGAYSHLASGANMVEYWHWHSNHYGQETYWKGLLGHDLQPNRVFDEVKQFSGEIKRVGNHLINLKKENKVAILYSGDSYAAINLQPFNDKAGYVEVMRQMYDALYRNNIGCDFIVASEKDWSRYKMIVIPPLYIASDELLQKIKTYVKNGGVALMSFKSGFCNENDGVRPVVMPGILREAAGMYYHEFSSVWRLKLKSSQLSLDSLNDYCKTWAEMIIPERANVLSSYEHSFFGKFAAITENNFGQGTLIYQGCMLNNPTEEKLIQYAAKKAGVLEYSSTIKFPLIVKSGKNSFNKSIHYYFNYSGNKQSCNYEFANGNELLTKAKINKQSKLEIDPWGVLIIEED